MSDGREQVELAADRIRDDLATTLRELDRRRQLATDWTYQVRRHRWALVALACGALASVGAMVASSIFKARARKRERPQRVLRALVRAWQHPDRLASRAEQRPVHQELGRKLLVAATVAIGSRVIERGIKEVLPVVPRREIDPLALN